MEKPLGASRYTVLGRVGLMGTTRVRPVLRARAQALVGLMTLFVLIAALACAPRPGVWTALAPVSKGGQVLSGRLGQVACGGPRSCLSISSLSNEQFAAAWDGTT